MGSQDEKRGIVPFQSPKKGGFNQLMKAQARVQALEVSQGLYATV